MARLRILELPGAGSPFAVIIDRLQAFDPSQDFGNIADRMGARAVLVFGAEVELPHPQTPGPITEPTSSTAAAWLPNPITGDAVKPTIGRTVFYQLSEHDADRITAMANRPLPDGCSPLHNSARAGDIYPAIMIRAWNDDTVNLHVLLDGELTLWVTSRHEGTRPGTWSWPPRA